MATATGITHTLQGFVTLDQRNEPSGDSGPDNNPDWNCVAASVAMGLTYLLGRPYYGDEVKDATYGENYTGAQAPEHYTAYLASLGVALVTYNDASGYGLVAYARSEIKLRHPVLVTMPSKWGIPVAQQQPKFTTHVGCAAGWGPGWLRLANPWGGFWQDGNDAYWAARICFGKVWSMSLIPGKGQASMWKAHGAGAIDSATPTPHAVGPGLAKLFLAAPNTADATDGEAPFNATGGVFVTTTDGQAAVWTLSEGARWDRGGLVIEAKLGEIRQLEAELAVAKAGDAPPAVVAKASKWDSLIALLGSK